MLITGARDRRARIRPRVHLGRTDAGGGCHAWVALGVVLGQVEIRVGGVEHNDVQVRIIFDEADQLGELKYGRRIDHVVGGWSNVTRQ